MSQAIVILLAAFVTACISGIFGMAGGLIFMGVIASFLGVAQSMIVHGAVQSMSNAYRAWLLRSFIQWRIIGYVLLGAFPAILILARISYVPDKATLFIMLGLLPLFLWLPSGWLQGDAERPFDAALCGFLVMSLNLTAGVAGPAFDFFFVKTSLSRQAVVATKAFIMLLSHLTKIVYFGIPLWKSTQLSSLPPTWVFIAAIPCVMLGTYLGTRILGRITDSSFRDVTKYLVTVIGFIYLLRGVSMLA